MSNFIFKFSDFIQDDGAFEDAERKINEFGERIVANARRIKTEFQRAFNLDDTDSVENLERQIEDLTDSFRQNQRAQENLNNIRQQAIRMNRQMSDSTEDQIDRLTELDRELQRYRGQLREINRSQRQGIQTDRDLNRERAEAQVNIRRVSTEIRGLQREIVNRNRLSRDQERLLRAQIALEREQVTTLREVRERISALRTVVQSLDFREQADQIQEYNNEINELTEILGENSDRFIQSRINVGNYEESIINALRSTELFGTGIAGLDNLIGQLINALTLTREELEAMEQSLAENSNGIRRLIVNFRRLNGVLRASIIGVVIVALGALSDAFGDTRAGSIRLQQVLSTLQTQFTAFTSVLGILFRSIGRGFEDAFRFFRIMALEARIAFESITSFSDEANENLERLRDQLAELVREQQRSNEEAENSPGLWESITNAIEQTSNATVRGLENIARAFEIEDNIRRLTQEITRLQGRLEILQARAGDSTISLREQLENNTRALQVAEQIAERNVNIARQRLELANERVRQNVEANIVEAENLNLNAQGVAFAEQVLDLAQRRGAQLEISNDLIEEQQNALVELIQAENEQAINAEESGRQRREIQRDLFEQNLDLLIDLIDTERNASAEIVQDISRNFRARINEFNRFLVQFRINAQRELDEFTTQAQRRGLDLDFQVQFDEDGNFDVFIGDTELAINNIVQLNEQLQATGLSEIEINRFREFLIETRNGVRDFRSLNDELRNAGENIRVLNESLDITNDQILALTRLDEAILGVRQALAQDISPDQRRRLVEQLTELERQRVAIIEFGEAQATQARIDAINIRLEQIDNESEEARRLLLERARLELQIINESAQEQVNAERRKQEQITQEQRKGAQETRRIIGLVLDAFVSAQSRQVTVAQEASRRQAEAVEAQQERARLGLSNTLAFEQRELANREAERIRQERRQERLQRIRALYASYTNYANQGDGQNALTRALRDFAILEAVSASFEKGGIVGVDGYDNVRTNQNGITVGRSHNLKGGVLAYHQGGEGFFSREEVGAMGEDNFRMLKHMAGKGQINSDFFKDQRKNFVSTVAVPQTDTRLLTEMKEVKRAIQNKPVSTWDVAENTRELMKLIETVATKNHVKRNTHIIKKPRL